MTGHTDSVSSLAWVPHTTFLLSGSYDQSMRLWDPQSGWELRRIGGHLAPIRSLAVSPDGTRALSGGGDGMVVVWDLRAARDLKWIPAHTGMINAVAFSPDGATFATASLDGTIGVWNAARGERVVTFHRQGTGINAVAFSPDGSTLYSGCDSFVPGADGPVARDVQTLGAHSVLGGDPPALPSTNEWILSLAIAPDGQWLAEGTGGAPSKTIPGTPTLGIIDLATGSILRVETNSFQGGITGVIPTELAIYTSDLSGEIRRIPKPTPPNP